VREVEQSTAKRCACAREVRWSTGGVFRRQSSDGVFLRLLLRESEEGEEEGDMME
jgi:hypothetical protein